MPIVVVGAGRVPAPPALTSVTAFDSAATVTWTAPADNGGSPVTGYTVNVATAVDGTIVLSVPVGAGALSATLAPLTNATQYAVTIAARNGVGSSQASAPALVTPVAGQPYFPPAPIVVDPPAYVPLPQPMVEAFPADRVFRPDYWGLTPDEVDAL